MSLFLSPVLYSCSNQPKVITKVETVRDTVTVTDTDTIFKTRTLSRTFTIVDSTQIRNLSATIDSLYATQARLFQVIDSINYLNEYLVARNELLHASIDSLTKVRSEKIVSGTDTLLVQYSPYHLSASTTTLLSCSFVVERIKEGLFKKAYYVVKSTDPDVVDLGGGKFLITKKTYYGEFRERSNTW